MNGYDLGGAEYPYDPEHLTVVDILTPEVDFEADYVRRDLSKSGWSDGLMPREFVYIGKTLRYLDVIESEFSDELDRIVDVGGRVEMFDFMKVIEPIMTELLSTGWYEIFSTDLINSPFDGKPAEYKIILMRQ